MIAGLTRIERFNIAVIERWHRVPPLSGLSVFIARFIIRPLFQLTLGWLVAAHHVEHLRAVSRARGILLCGNHRSYLDNFVIGSCAMGELPVRTRYVVPSRTEGMFDAWYGLVLNALIGGFNIYPPVVRSKRGHDWNQHVITILSDLLRNEQVAVLIHPEGGRNKGDDPYTLLPARPGLGRIVHQTGACVVPFFLHGFPRDLRAYGAAAIARLRGGAPSVQLVMGAPIDFTHELALPESPTLFHSMAQRITAAISDLMPEERALRALRDTTRPRG